MINEEKAIAALGIYRSTWDKFYLWEEQECLRVLNSLRATSPTSSSTNVDASLAFKTRPPPCESGFVPFFVEEYDECGSVEPLAISMLHIEDTLHVTLDADSEEPGTPNSSSYRGMKPSEWYQSCASSSKVVVPAARKQSPAFLPLADDPQFKIYEYMGKFKLNPQWQLPMRDPDG